MATALEQAAEAGVPAATDQSFVLHGIDWRTYSVLRALLDRPGLHMTYFRGRLELDFGREEKEAGLEPDECYAIGKDRDEYPDLAIEVALRPGYLEKLDAYQALGVREVWYWVGDEGFRLYRLGEQGYEPVSASALLPTLDLQQLASCVRQPDQHEAVRAYRDALRAR